MPIPVRAGAKAGHDRGSYRYRAMNTARSPAKQGFETPSRYEPLFTPSGAINNEGSEQEQRVGVYTSVSPWQRGQRGPSGRSLIQIPCRDHAGGPRGHQKHAHPALYAAFGGRKGATRD